MIEIEITLLLAYRLRQSLTITGFPCCDVAPQKFIQNLENQTRRAPLQCEAVAQHIEQVGK